MLCFYCAMRKVVSLPVQRPKQCLKHLTQQRPQYCRGGALSSCPSSAPFGDNALRELWALPPSLSYFKACCCHFGVGGGEVMVGTSCFKTLVGIFCKLQSIWLLMQGPLSPKLVSFKTLWTLSDGPGGAWSVVAQSVGLLWMPSH